MDNSTQEQCRVSALMRLAQTMIAQKVELLEMSRSGHMGEQSPIRFSAYHSNGASIDVNEIPEVSKALSMYLPEQERNLGVQYHDVGSVISAAIRIGVDKNGRYEVEEVASCDQLALTPSLEEELKFDSFGEMMDQWANKGRWAKECAVHLTETFSKLPAGEKIILEKSRSQIEGHYRFITDNSKTLSQEPSDQDELMEMFTAMTEDFLDPNALGEEFDDDWDIDSVMTLTVQRDEAGALSAELKKFKLDTVSKPQNSMEKLHSYETPLPTAVRRSSPYFS